MDHLISLIFDLINGLIEMKANKITHSDIKPSNILKTKEGFYVYSDFGTAAKRKNKIFEKKGYTPKYASPE